MPEGVVSTGVGVGVESKSLTAFGIQSIVEILSAVLTIYRFRHELNNDSAANVVLEKRSTLGIGILLVVLAIGTWAASISALVHHIKPTSSTLALIVSVIMLIFSTLLWLPKPWIAAELNSSVMHGEACCSLACMYSNIILLSGFLIFKFWPNGWFIDSSVAILLGFSFGHDGWSMISWARSKDFNGNIHKPHCLPSTKNYPSPNTSKSSTYGSTTTDDPATNNLQP
ncbi:unnamed protein product [Adineta ricciae]|uniref:Transmembrane protein 163 n=2 Tax=Adineta ricciae TaxID=249248 RepID=A0A816DRS5_ADIRI|nr:unnamed protein product [Adineta ricciae]